MKHGWPAFYLSLLLVTLQAFIATTKASAEDTPKQEMVILFSAEGTKIHNLRLEMFGDAGHSVVFDTGLIEGTVVSLPRELLDSILGENATIKYELRAWDISGNLILSQISISESPDFIFQSDFTSIKSETAMKAAGGITLDGNTDVLGNISVSGAAQLSQIQDSEGGTFFDSCAPGSSIRSIDTTGSVVCQTDSVGGGGGDNLGNHIASQSLTMGNNFIDFNPERGLRASGGGVLRTGVNGHTFQLFAGAPLADTARFWTSGGSNLILSINKDGIHFEAGQKACSCYNASIPRSTILASAGWTASNCSAYKDAVCPDGSYQLFCIFDDAFTFGPADGPPPSRNCGW